MAIQLINKDEPKMIKSKKMAWLIIQSSDEGDEDGEWESMMPQDVPDWVKENECIGKMMEGKMVCADPEKNTKWYRAVKCDPPTSH